jgi:hypothetical protein
MEVTEDIRRLYGLPITKDIVYYPNRHKIETLKVINIVVVEIFRYYFSTWSEFEITLEDGTTRHIHSDYLAEMQKPNFVEMENK